MKEIKPDSTWHDAPGDLERLGLIEQEISISYMNNDHTMLYKLLRVYYLNLYSIIRFDDQEKNDLLDQFQKIATMIKNADLDNSGDLDDFEQQQASEILGKAMLEMEDLFANLKTIKTKNGLSVDISAHQKTKHAKAMLESIDKWVDKHLFKSKGELESIFVSKISQD